MRAEYQTLARRLAMIVYGSIDRTVALRPQAPSVVGSFVCRGAELSYFPAGALHRSDTRAVCRAAAVDNEPSGLAIDIGRCRQASACATSH